MGFSPDKLNCPDHFPVSCDSKVKPHTLLVLILYTGKGGTQPPKALCSSLAMAMHR
jgi:hypothetical protein